MEGELDGLGSRRLGEGLEACGSSGGSNYEAATVHVEKDRPAAVRGTRFEVRGSRFEK